MTENNVLQFRPKAAHVATGGDFGGCPVCGQGEEYVNVEREHFFICRDHKVFWNVGSNLFSSWKEQDEAHWRDNAALLLTFTEVDPIQPSIHMPLIEYADKVARGVIAPAESPEAGGKPLPF